MSANSRSEMLWDILHEVEGVVLHGGFVPPYPHYSPRTSSTPKPADSLGNIQSRYSDHLAIGCPWPQTRGCPSPRAVILTADPLGEKEEAFVRSWFENPRVNLRLDEDFWLQPLPPFTGDTSVAKAYLAEVVQSLNPKVILSLGESPARLLLGAPLSLDSLRSTDYIFSGYPLVTTYHPASFLSLSEELSGERNRLKALIWKDIQRLIGKINYA